MFKGNWRRRCDIPFVFQCFLVKGLGHQGVETSKRESINEPGNREDDSSNSGSDGWSTLAVNLVSRFYCRNLRTQDKALVSSSLMTALWTLLFEQFRSLLGTVV